MVTGCCSPPTRDSSACQPRVTPGIGPVIDLMGSAVVGPDLLHQVEAPRAGRRPAAAGRPAGHAGLSPLAEDRGAPPGVGAEHRPGSGRPTDDLAARCTRSEWVAQPRELINSRQAVSQRRQDSAQTRQCSCISACCAHSSPHALHAAAHASSAARVTFAS